MRVVFKCDGVIDDMLSAAGKCVKSAKTWKLQFLLLWRRAREKEREEYTHGRFFSLEVWKSWNVIKNSKGDKQISDKIIFARNCEIPFEGELAQPL